MQRATNVLSQSIEQSFNNVYKTQSPSLQRIIETIRLQNGNSLVMISVVCYCTTLDHIKQSSCVNVIRKHRVRFPVRMPATTSWHLWSVSQTILDWTVGHVVIVYISSTCLLVYNKTYKAVYWQYSLSCQSRISIICISYSICVFNYSDSTTYFNFNCFIEHICIIHT